MRDDTLPTPRQPDNGRISEVHSREDSYRLLFESNLQPMWFYDIETLRFLAVNDAAIDHYGFSRDEFLAMTIKDIRPPEDIPQMLSAVAEVETGVVTYERAWRHRKRDGTIIYVRITSQVLTYLGCRAELIVAQDVTKHQTMQEQLRRSEQLFRALTENALDVITILDREGRVLYESPAVTRMTGYTPDEIIGTNAFDLVHPEDMAAMRREFKYKLRHPGKVVPFESRLRHKDGTWRHIEGTGVNLLHDPAVGGIVVNSRDVTERKAVEAERGLERRVLDALIDQLPLGVMFRDREGRYTQANRRIAVILGVEREQLVGLLGDDMVQLTRMSALDGEPLDSGAELPSTRALERGESVESDERLIKTLAGEVRHVVTTATPIKIDDEIYGSVVVIDDITERRREQEQLRQSQKMEAIGRLAGGVAHDFNNLLTAITGYSDLILRRADASQTTRKHAEQIRRAADRAAALTQQLLAFSRKQMLRTRVFNLNVIIAEMEEMLRRLIGEDVHFETRLAPDLAFIKADPHQMEQVIVNLAINARDALAAGGTLLIETRNAGNADTTPHAELAPDRRYCVLTVRDTGHGMNEETRRRIFEPFFTTKEQGKGTGLGLATVYGIVKQSGGHVVVNSEQGQGTIFEIYLPTADANPTAANESKPPEDTPTSSATPTPCDAPNGATVLLVEDEEIVRRMACEVLREHGYTVIEAGNGRIALDICRSHNEKIDLMITDVVMPEMGGAELASAVRGARPEMPVLFMSGYTDDAVIRHGVHERERAFIHKPWTPAAFLAKVRELIKTT